MKKILILILTVFSVVILLSTPVYAATNSISFTIYTDGTHSLTGNNFNTLYNNRNNITGVDSSDYDYPQIYISSSYAGLQDAQDYDVFTLYSSGSYSTSTGIRAKSSIYITVYYNVSNPITYYTVNFYDYYGSLLKTQQVEKGKSADAPSLPPLPSDTKTTSYYNARWNKSYSNITSNTDVYADYSTSTIYWYIYYRPGTGTGNAVNNSTTYNDYLTIKSPETLGYKKPGYNFKYWTTNSNGSGTKYYPGESTRMTTDFYLYAQWEIADNVAPTISGPTRIVIRKFGRLSESDIRKQLTANDNVDGNITSKIKLESDNYTGNTNLGTYTIIYSVTDIAGNKTTHTVSIIIADNVAPIIYVLVDFNKGPNLNYNEIIYLLMITNQL